MRNIVISAAKGSGPSILKAMAVGKVLLDQSTGYCHDSWDYATTQAGDRITFVHEYDATKIHGDILIGIRIDPSNILQIVHRCVMVDFEYANDPLWQRNDWCWTSAFHDRIAGPDWPSYSKKITDYPEWCRNEMCQVAWEKISPWTNTNTDFDYVIDSREMFDLVDPVSLTNCLKQIGCQYDQEFLQQWSLQNKNIWQQQKQLFSWQAPDV